MKKIKENWLLLLVASVAFIDRTITSGYESIGIQKAEVTGDLAAIAGATAIAETWWKANCANVVSTVVTWIW